MILTIRTDKPIAELGLFESGKEIRYNEWQAHRQLSDTIHAKLRDMLNSANADIKSIEGVIFYHGPGSFTGLRIGAALANALAYSLNAPIISSGGKDWMANGLRELSKGGDDKLALPKYGSAPKITKPRK